MSDWLPSLNALRAFEAAARHLSYVGAAEELAVTPAAVKQLVQKLEATLGVTLLRRDGRGIALTQQGLAARGDLAQGFRQIEQAVAGMRRRETRRALTLTVEPSFATSWLLERLPDFERRHPGLDVLVDSSLRVADLSRENIDVAIRYGVEHGADVVARRLFDDEIIAVCSPAVAERLHGVEDLARVPLVHMDFTSGAMAESCYCDLFDWPSWLRLVGYSHVTPAKGPRFNDYNLAIQAAIASHGVALGSTPVVATAIAAGLLVAPLDIRARSGVSYDMVVPPDAGAQTGSRRLHGLDRGRGRTPAAPALGGAGPYEPSRSST